MLSRRLNISLTMERRFQIPSGSRPLRGLSRHAHSAAAGGSVDDRYMEFTSLRQTELLSHLPNSSAYRSIHTFLPEDHGRGPTELVQCFLDVVA